jgi:vitamin B12 transporter
LLARIATCLLSAALPCTAARADAPASGDAPIEVEARSVRGIAATHGQDPTASGTSLELTDRVTMPRSLGDVVREAPGSNVISTGGMGSFASLSLRGASADETLVLLDEIPLSTPDGGAFDLSLYPVELFERVNVFRGGAPVWLGSGAIGGVMQLVPRRGDRNGLNAAVGAGSYGSYQLNAGSETSLDSGMSSHSQLVLRGTRGDYPYLDDRGTLFDSSDDRTFKLKNADFHDYSGFQDFSTPLGHGRLQLVAMGVSRGGGLSGPAAQPTPKVRRDAARALTAAAYTIEGGAERRRKLQLLAAGSFGVDRYTDLQGQLGLSSRSATENRSFRGLLRSAGSLDATSWLRGTLVGAYSLDAYLPHEHFIRPDPGTSSRHTASGALELLAHGKLGPVRYELRPSVRLEWSSTQVQSSGSAPSKRDVLVPTGRVGGVLEPWRGLALSASFASGTRLPTMLELFGDGGFVLPNRDLRPVKSTTYDAGVTLKGTLGIARGSLEARVFRQQRKDAIAQYRTNQYESGFENLSRVQQWGFESHISGELTRWFRASGSFTQLETETALNKRLPFRPRFVMYARPELRIPIAQGWLSSASLASELWHRSFSFYDDSNSAYSPACTKLGFGAGLNLFRESVRLAARLDDALDARCLDLLGYPLQGRSLFFTLSFTEVDPHAS